MFNKSLRQIFNDKVLLPIARLPLIGPHGGHDVELLLAGAKPAAIVGFVSSEEQRQLDKALKEGRLISCRYPVSRTARFHFYTAPGFEEQAVALQTVFSKSHDERNMSREEELAFYRRVDETGFFGDGVRNLQGMGKLKTRLIDALDTVAGKLQYASLAILPAIQMRLLTNRLSLTHSVNELLQGKRKIGAFAEHGTLPPDLKIKLDEAVSGGLLTVSSQDFAADYTMTLYGLPGQEENLQKLADRCNAQEGDPELGKPYIGELLGYSDRDESLWQNGWPRNKIAGNLLYATQDMRRALRTRLMLEAGPAWKRNMDF
jgi:hypothetical protein